MTSRRRFLAAASSGLVARAAEWPQWRGAGRDGKANESGLLRQWPANGPKVVWTATGLGEGYSSFSVAGGRLFTQGQQGRTEFVFAYDAATGRKLWATPAGGSYNESRGNGPRGTPTVDGPMLYSMSADGTLTAISKADGKKQWEQNIVDKFGGAVAHWGMSESPLIDGNRVIVQPGGRGAAVVALDKTSGKLIWKSGSDRAGYASAIAFDFGGIRNVVAFTGEGVVGMNAATGELLWRYDKVANRTANIATPLYSNGHLFVSSDYGTGCALLKLSGEGGKVKAQEVYFNRDMRNHYCSSVLVGEHLYGFSANILTCMKLLTGEVAWRDRSVGKGQLLFADGMLFLQGEEGVLALAEATPAAYKELARHRLGRGEYPVWTQPVVADGRLFVRDQDRLACFAVRAS
jgi:outer membrane protein assembly factor BamB